jgi:hypothetical protein
MADISDAYYANIGDTVPLNTFTGFTSATHTVKVPDYSQVEARYFAPDDPLPIEWDSDGVARMKPPPIPCRVFVRVDDGWQRIE